MLDYSLEHICSMLIKLNPPEVIGPIPEGIRANFYIAEGKIEGPKLTGHFHPVGGDWLTVRSDGVAILDVRATLETHDGAVIYTAYTGVGDLGEDGYQKFLEQDLPPTIQLRITPRYHTAHPAYQWLNRVQCVGIGQVEMSSLEVSYDIYAIH